jgi:hypothetical protein
MSPLYYPLVSAAILLVILALISRSMSRACPRWLVTFMQASLVASAGVQVAIVVMHARNLAFLALPIVVLSLLCNLAVLIALILAVPKLMAHQRTIRGRKHEESQESKGA